jgi:O-antigen/teichoic acid export membrane protein
MVGALSLSVGVTSEAIASKIMVRTSVAKLLSKDSKPSAETSLSYGNITAFYYPLALTSILGLGVHPMVTFFLGKSFMAIESLAVMPVVSSLVFIFRSLGLSYQEACIALFGDRNEGLKMLRNFAVLLGIGISGGLMLVAFTQISFLWFKGVSGLSLQLTQFSILPTRILVLLPALTVLLSFQRSFLVINKKTRPITLATSIEVFGILILLFFTIKIFGMIGAIAAAISLVSGRFFANCYLFVPISKILRNHKHNPNTQQISRGV